MGKKLVLAADTDTRAYMAVMKKIRKKEYPETVAAVLNRTANGVTIGQERNVRQNLRLRSKKFTLRSMRSARAKPWKALNSARGDRVERMFSRAGSFSSYLWKQEKSMTVRSISGQGVPIPTEHSRTSGDESRAVARRYRLSRSQSLRDGAMGKKLFVGRPRGGGKRGLYLRAKGRLWMLRNLEHKSVKISGIGFHRRAVERYGNAQVLAALYRKEAKKRLSGVSRG